jgi:AbrB family looped-hinge helix DNA binding protein
MHGRRVPCKGGNHGQDGFPQSVLVRVSCVVTTAGLTLDYGLVSKMGSVARVSEGGKMNIPASVRREVGLEHGGPVMVSVVGGEIRMRVLAQVLTDLQNEARDVFAHSGETVDGFLRDRRAEARRDGDLPA